MIIVVELFIVELSVLYLEGLIVIIFCMLDVSLITALIFVCIFADHIIYFQVEDFPDPIFTFKYFCYDWPKLIVKLSSQVFDQCNTNLFKIMYSIIAKVQSSHHIFFSPISVF